MKQSTVVLLVLALSIAACGSSADVATPISTIPSLPERPELAVDHMVAALMLKDVEEIRLLTSDHQLAIIIALESGGTEELSAMLEQGVPDEAAENFWMSFVDGFPDLVGESIENMEFGTSIPYRVRDVEYVSFPVSFGSSTAGTEWFVRSTEFGWQIDLIATFGGPFAAALESLVEGTADPAVLDIIRGEVASIEAAYERHSQLGTSERVRDALKSLLEAVSN